MIRVIRVIRVLSKGFRFRRLMILPPRFNNNKEEAVIHDESLPLGFASG
jgi:hypothetical protein